METIEYYKNLKDKICSCVFDIQQFFLFKDIEGSPISRGVSLRSWFIYVVSGKGTALMERLDYPLIKGSLLTIRPGAEFILSPGKGEKLTYYAIGFMYKSGSPGKDAGDEASLLSGYYRLANTIRIESLLKEMRQLSLNGNPDANPEMKCAFYNLMTCIWKDIRSGLDNLSIYKRIEKTTAYLYENFDKEIRMEDLAGMCGVSKEYFIRAFKDYTGTPPCRFIINLRMNKAKEALMTENRKVSEVAALVGYKDEFYFSRLFKKTVGVSPLFYSMKNIY